jgi:hypothetical protein
MVSMPVLKMLSLLKSTQIQQFLMRLVGVVFFLFYLIFWAGMDPQKNDMFFPPQFLVPQIAHIKHIFAHISAHILETLGALLSRSIYSPLDLALQCPRVCPRLLVCTALSWKWNLLLMLWVVDFS